MRGRKPKPTHLKVLDGNPGRRLPDRAALAASCQAYGRWVEAERKLKETPTLLKLPSGYFQHNPWLTIATKQLELMHKYMAELGLTPSSRSRVSVTQPHT